jgi:hypothetical protein
MCISFSEVCGSHTVSTHQVVDGFFHIHFHSDAGTEARGFQISITALYRQGTYHVHLYNQGVRGLVINLIRIIHFKVFDLILNNIHQSASPPNVMLLNTNV